MVPGSTCPVPGSIVHGTREHHARDSGATCMGPGCVKAGLGATCIDSEAQGSAPGSTCRVPGSTALGTPGARVLGTWEHGAQVDPGAPCVTSGSHARCLPGARALPGARRAPGSKPISSRVQRVTLLGATLVAPGQRPGLPGSRVVRTRVRSALLMGPKHLAPLFLLACSCDRSPSLAVASTMHPDPAPHAPSRRRRLCLCSAARCSLTHLRSPDAELAPASRDVRAAHARGRGGDVVLVDVDHAGLFDAGYSQVHRAVHALLAGPFPVRPTVQAELAHIFSTHPAYVAFSKELPRISNSSRTDPARGRCSAHRRTPREILMIGTTGWGTPTHEIVHPFIQRWFGGDGADRGARLARRGHRVALRAARLRSARRGASTARRTGATTSFASRSSRRTTARPEALFDMSDDAFVAHDDATTQGCTTGWPGTFASGSMPEESSGPSSMTGAAPRQTGMTRAGSRPSREPWAGPPRTPTPRGSTTSAACSVTGTTAHP